MPLSIQEVAHAVAEDVEGVRIRKYLRAEASTSGRHVDKFFRFFDRTPGGETAEDIPVFGRPAEPAERFDDKTKVVFLLFHLQQKILLHLMQN